jgi:hypothetical protein
MCISISLLLTQTFPKISILTLHVCVLEKNPSPSPTLNKDRSEMSLYRVVPLILQAGFVR